MQESLLKTESENWNKKSKIISIILNCVFILSSCGFAFLMYQDNTNIVFYVLFLVLLTYLIFKHIPNLIFEKLRNIDKLTLVVSLVSTIFAIVYFVFYLEKSVVSLIVTKTFLTVVSIPFVFVSLCFAYGFIFKKIVEFYKSLSKVEKWLALSILIAGLLIILITNILTAMFNGSVPSMGVDIQFLSFDVFSCSEEQIFINFFTFRNNVRHALITLFAFPLYVVPGCISFVLGIAGLMAVFVQIVQLLMCVILIVLVKKWLTFDSKFTEILFCLFLAVSAGVLFSFLAYENFVIASFFIVLTVDAVIKKSNDKYVYFVASVGTLTTSLMLFPFVFFDKETKFKTSVLRAINCAVCFVLLLVLAGQIHHLVYGYKELTDAVGAFGGEQRSFVDKLAQYFESYSIMFLAPNTFDNGRILWFTKTTFNGWLTYCGIIVFVISILGFVTNRKDKICQFGFYWLLFMTFCDLIVGWGVEANELFIYSLTYIWAISVLFYKGLQFFIRNKTAFNLIVAIIVIGIFAYNLFGLIEFIEFGLKRFPIIM